MAFISSVLGCATHPINIIPEYFDAFGSKPKAAILSWLDGWKRTTEKEWVWLVLEDLASELKWCRDTIHRHLKDLLKLNVVERKKANRWYTDQAYQYRINREELMRHIDFRPEDVAVSVDTRNSDSGQSEDIPSTVENSEIYLNQSSNQDLNHTDNNVIARDDFFKKEVDQEELAALEVKVDEVEECINRNWLNYEAALLELKRQIFKKGCENPTGFLLEALRFEWGKNSAAPVEKNFEPSIETVEALSNRFGADKLIKDFVPNEELGYPFVLCVDLGVSWPWWNFLEVSNG